MREEWRPVVGYEGLYEVSNMGRVKSVERTAWCGNGYRTVHERILRTRKNRYGYVIVNLYQEGKMKTCCIHRLVAESFIPNPDNLPDINHKDEDKTNNNVDNLEWCSRSYNNTYNGRAKKAGKKIGKKLRNHPKTSKPIIGIDKVTGLIVEFPSTHEASRQLGIGQNNICACCKGKLKSCGGFYWYYSNADNNNDDAE